MRVDLPWLEKQPIGWHSRRASDSARSCFRRGTKVPSSKLLTVLSLLSCLALAVLVRAQKPSVGVGDRERERRSLAADITRAINSAEADYLRKHETFANWDTLFSNGDFTENGTKWAPESFPSVAHAMYGRDKEIVPGWKLRLNISNNGKSYDLLLEDTSDPKCLYAIVSDERGVIRHSKALDCPI